VSGRRQLAVALTAAGLALGLGACGDDEEPAAATSTTEETTSTTEATSSTTASTTESTSSTTSTTSTTEETTTTTDEIELEPEGGDDSGGSGPRGDSEENDKPPAEGSPEASFEEFCDENPKECG
jgi:hypothetical protein